MRSFSAGTIQKHCSTFFVHCVFDLKKKIVPMQLFFTKKVLKISKTQLFQNNLHKPTVWNFFCLHLVFRNVVQFFLCSTSVQKRCSTFLVQSMCTKALFPFFCPEHLYKSFVSLFLSRACVQKLCFPFSVQSKCAKKLFSFFCPEHVCKMNKKNVQVFWTGFFVLGFWTRFLLVQESNSWLSVRQFCTFSVFSFFCTTCSEKLSFPFRTHFFRAQKVCFFWTNFFRVQKSCSVWHTNCFCTFLR